MKRFTMLMTVCFLLGSISSPAPTLTAAPVGHRKHVQAITQDPVVPPKTANIVFSGPSKCKAGDLVVLSVEGSHASSFKWTILPSTDNFLVIDGGKRAVFSSGVGGEFKFIVACAYKDTCDVYVHTLVVNGDKPQPTDNLSSKIAFHCDKVDSVTKRDDCIKLAQSFASVAMVMEGGNLNTPSDIVQATAKSNKDALGDRLDDWKPFRSGLASELEALAKAGHLTDTASHVRVWKIIADALREYATTL